MKAEQWLLGRVELRGKWLVLEVNSLVRADRGKRMSAPPRFKATPYFALAHPSAEKSINATTPVLQSHMNFAAIVIGDD